MKKLLSAILFCCSAVALNAKTVKVGYYIDAGNFMSGFTSQDERKGYAYEYLQNIASYTDWEFEYVYGYWDSLYEKLLSGEIDLLTDVSFSKERTALFNYSDFPMGQENYYLYANKDNTTVNPEDLSSLNGKTIELSSGTYQYDLFKKWIKKSGLNLKIKESSFEDLSEQNFRQGLYDLYLSIDLVADKDWEPVVKIGSSDIYVVVTKERTDILVELNEAQNSLYHSNPYYNNSLWNKYFSNVSVTKRISQREKNWLDGKNSLNVGCFKGDYLYTPEYLNGKTVSVLEYLISKLTEQFDLNNLEINYKYYETRLDIIDALKRGEIDIAFPFLYNLYEAENEGISLSQPVIQTSFCYVYLDGTNFDDIGKKVSLAKGKRAAEFFNSTEYSKTAEIKYYNTVTECLDATIVGEVTSSVLNTGVMESFIFGRKKYKKLKSMNIDVPESICFAAYNQNTTIISLINKMISTLNKNELQMQLMKQSISDRNYTLYEFLDDYLSLVIAIVFVLFLLIVALGASFYYIKMLVNYDVLTHLLNRRSLKTYIQRYIEKADKQKENFCVVIFDLDNFKHINDTYGHEVGDEVLKTAAEVIQKSISLEDKVFRWGGEEFLLILNTNKILAEKIANRIRVNLAAQVFEKDGEEFFVTLTGGLSVYETGRDYTEMFVEADKNLYRGKELGKNVIIC